MPRRPSLTAAALLATALLGAACGQAATGDPTMVAVQLDPVDPTVAAGRSVPIGALGLWSDGFRRFLPGTIRWSVSDTSVATVDAAGLARGVAPGTATVSAFHEESGLTGSVALIVTAPVLEALVLSPGSGALPAGLSRTLTVEGRRSDGSTGPLDGGLAWSSSAPDVATVDAAGVALALRPGATTIRATHAASGLSATATLTVSDAVVQRLEISPATPSLAPGLALQLSATAHFTDGTTAPLGAGGTWSSSASAAVATVDAAGLLQASSPGLAEVTVTHGASGVSATVRVTVTAAALTRLDLSPAAPNLPLGLGVTIAVTGHASDGSSGPVVAGLAWSVADPVVASVDGAGQVRGLAEGSTSITASHGPSGLAGTVPVVVGPAVIVSLAMSPAETTVAVGQRFDLMAATFAITGTSSDGERRFLGPYVVAEPIGAIAFEWTTSDAAVAQVAARGRLTALAPGRATITARDPASGLTAASLVTVVPDVQVGVYVSPYAATLQVGGWDALMAGGRYLSGGTSLYIGPFPGAWTSSDPSVATVNDQGIVTAVAPGTATITFTDSRNGLAGTSVITVQ